MLRLGPELSFGSKLHVGDGVNALCLVCSTLAALVSGLEISGFRVKGKFLHLSLLFRFSFRFRNLYVF